MFRCSLHWHLLVGFLRRVWKRILSKRRGEIVLKGWGKNVSSSLLGWNRYHREALIKHCVFILFVSRGALRTSRYRRECIFCVGGSLGSYWPNLVIFFLQVYDLHAISIASEQYYQLRSYSRSSYNEGGKRRLCGERENCIFNSEYHTILRISI